MAKIFEIRLGISAAGNSLQGITRKSLKICTSATRQFFSLPTRVQLMRSDKTYTLSVYDRKMREGLKVRSGVLDIEAEYRWEGNWEQLDLNSVPYRALKKLFRESGKKYLYVVITENI